MIRKLFRCLCLIGVLGTLAACAKPGAVVSEVTVERNPNKAVPLAAIARFTTSEPALAWATIADADRSFETPAGTEFKTEHEIVLLGLQPNTVHTVTVSTTTRDGRGSTGTPVQYKTFPLPQDFPPIEVVVSIPEKMEPGFTLVPATRWPKGAGPDRSFGVVYALDEAGRIVWYYQAPHNITDIFRRDNGNLMFHYGRFGNAAEIDLLGNTVREFHATGSAKRIAEGSIPVKTTNFHHEFHELPNGNFTALSLEVRYFEKYPASETDPDVPWEPAYVIGDVLVEFRPDGSVVKYLPLMDVLDPFRICYDSLDTGFWQDVFADKLPEPGKDWSHANAIEYVPGERAALVSLYHQDAVVKINLETDEVEWILGFPTGWREGLVDKLLAPVGDGMYPAHQHSGRLTPHGTLILYDNGAFRARPFEPKVPADQTFSRAVEYEIDEENMTFKQLWAYGGPEDEIFFSPFLGEVNWLPKKENILIADGGRVRRPDGGPGGHPNHGKEWARVLEVTHTTPAEKVFEIVIEEDKWGWTVYRAERISSLYPK